MVSYWSYWIHRIQELWNNYEDVNERLNNIEKRLETLESSSQVRQAPVRSPREAIEKAQEGGAPPSSVGVVISTLRHLGRPATVDEINAMLKKQGIDESLKETLLGRLKEGVKKGYLAYDPESKKFGLAG